jgi:hypothetical protein
VVAPVFVAGDIPTAAQVNNWMVNTAFVYKTANEALTASTTLQDDNHLVLPVDASYTYIVDMVIVYDSPTAADLKWQLVGPAGATLNAWEGGLTVAAVDTTNTRIDYTGLSTNNSNTHAGIGVGNPVVILCHGVLVNSSTAGTLKLQWAQVAASGTTTVYTGSYLRLVRVA